MDSFIAMDELKWNIVHSQVVIAGLRLTGAAVPVYFSFFFVGVRFPYHEKSTKNCEMTISMIWSYYETRYIDGITSISHVTVIQ